MKNINVMILLVLASLQVHAQSKPTTQPAAQGTQQGASSDRLDVSDLEKKYWAAKDADYSVVQNRLYSKVKKVGVSLGYGILVNDAWSDGPTTAVSASYFWSERYGIELAYSNTASKDSQAADRLRTQGGVPDHAKMKGYTGIALNWVPFYAKMSVLNNTIIYFDMAITPGIGLVEYEQQIETGNIKKSSVCFSLDFTQYFFWSKWFALRFDFKNRWFNQEVVNYRVSASTTARRDTQMFNESIIVSGMTFFF